MKLGYSEKRIVFDFLALIVISWSVGLITGITLMSRSPWALILAAFSLLLVIAFRYIVEDWANRELGKKGEFKIQTILSELWPKGVRSLHNLVLNNRGDIDHVVIAPSGVWTIETKSINGVFTLNGSRSVPKKYLDQAYAESMAVKEYLSTNGINLNVQPILALAGKYTKVEFNEPLKGVFVLGSLDLKKVIVQNSKPVLSKEQIDRIVGILKQSQEH